MDAVLRGAVVYLVLLLVIRLSGRRTLAEMTVFDFVLMLVIAEASQQALLGEDFSVTNGILVIVTLVGLNVLFSLLKARHRGLARVIEGLPLVLVENGRPLKDRLSMSRVDESDIMAAARKLRGLESMAQIKYAVLEADGAITIIPCDRAAREAAD